MGKAISFGASKAKAAFEEKVYEARIVRIIGKGLRAGYKPTDKPKEQCRIVFEVPAVTIDGDNGEKVPALKDMPFMNITGGGPNPSNFEKLMAAAGVKAGASFEDLLDKVVAINITKKGDYLNISQVSGVSDGVKATVPPLVAKSYFFDFDAPDAEIFASMPDFIKQDFKKALNFSGSKVEELLNAEEGNDSEEIGGSL